MAWTTPRTWVVGEIVTAAEMNAHVRDNMSYLHGDAGATIDVSAGGQLLKTALVTSGPITGTLPTATPVGTILTNGAAISFASAVGNLAYVIGINNNTDVQYRFGITGDGTISWGTGALARDASLSRVAAGQLYANQKVLEGLPSQVLSAVLPFTFTPNLATGLTQKVGLNGGGAGTLTIAAPTNAPSGTQTSFLVILITQASGGTVTITWNAAYLATGVTALPTSRATGTTTVCLFVWNGGNWLLLAVN